MDAQERYAALLEKSATGAPLSETLDALVGYVEDELPGALASLLLLDDDGVHLRLGSAPRVPAAYSAAIDGIAIGPDVGSCGTAAFTRDPIFVEDIDRDPRWLRFRDLAASHELRACWSTPIVSRRRPGPSIVLGTFAVYYRTPRAPDQHARDVLARAGLLACIAIEADRTQVEMREQAAQFRAFVDHATDAFLVMSVPGVKIVDVNLQACRALGYAREELLGQTPAFFDRAGTPAFMADLGRRLGAGETVTFESRHVRKDGTSFPVEIRLRRFTTPGGTFCLTLVRDITARLELEEQLRQAVKMEAVGRLAGGVAHDFNNLLTVINGYTEVLLTDAEGGLRDDLGVIRDAGARAAALTAQLLAFSRRTIIAPRPLDLSALVARLARMFERVLGEDITLVTRAAPGLASVMADPNQLEQVVLNLVVNARDAMPRGGTLTIATEVIDVALLGGAMVCLSVEDTGEGMPEEVRARVFEPFFTTKAQGKGTGLGLATAYGIVKQANGYLQVESVVGRGSKFSVLLPAIDIAEEVAESLPGLELRGRETVLLAEDEPGVRALIERGLTMHGYTVISAPDGETALRREREYAGTIDLLITDVVMPGRRGPEVAVAIKQRRPAIRVLFISGYTDDDVVRSGVVAGDAFLQKPFTPHGLVYKVRTVLDA